MDVDVCASVDGMFVYVQCTYVFQPCRVGAARFSRVCVCVCVPVLPCMCVGGVARAVTLAACCLLLCGCAFLSLCVWCVLSAAEKNAALYKFFGLRQTQVFL
jgi:hypothetical protein